MNEHCCGSVSTMTRSRVNLAVDEMVEDGCAHQAHKQSSQLCRLSFVFFILAQ